MNVPELDFDRYCDDEFTAAAAGERATLVTVRCTRCKSSQHPPGEVYGTAVGPMLVTWKPAGGGLPTIIAEHIAKHPDLYTEPMPRNATFPEDTSFYVRTGDGWEHLGIAPSHRRPGVVFMGISSTLRVRCLRHGERRLHPRSVERAVRKATMSGKATVTGA